MITANTIPLRTYSLPYKPINIDKKQYHKKSMAIILAIGFDKGVVHVEQFEYSVNKEKFALFMRELREKLIDERLSCVLDNLSVHKCKDSINLMQELDIKPIFCVPY